MQKWHTTEGAATVAGTTAAEGGKMVSWHDVKRGWNELTNIDWGFSPEVNRGVEAAKDLWNNATSSNSYSDFVSKTNENTDGWYSAIAGGIPFVNNLHNAILSRDRSRDYLNNTGLSWKDIPGYNAAMLTGGVSSAISGAASTAMRIADGKHDLYEFYSGEPDAGYGTRMYG